jgi:hypothetical protein
MWDHAAWVPPLRFPSLLTTWPCGADELGPAGCRPCRPNEPGSCPWPPTAPPIPAACLVSGRLRSSGRALGAGDRGREDPLLHNLSPCLPGPWTPTAQGWWLARPLGRQRAGVGQVPVDPAAQVLVLSMPVRVHQQPALHRPPGQVERSAPGSARAASAVSAANQRPSWSASCPVTTASSIRSARYKRRRAPLSARAFEVSGPSPLAFLAWPVARWQGANPCGRAAAEGVALSQEASGSGRGPRQITVPRTPMSSSCCRMPGML